MKRRPPSPEWVPSFRNRRERPQRPVDDTSPTLPLCGQGEGEHLFRHRLGLVDDTVSGARDAKRNHHVFQ